MISLFKNFVVLRFFENTRFSINVIFVIINFKFVIRIFFILIDLKTMYSIIVAFNISFKNFKTNKSLIFNHNNVNQKFFCEIIHKNNKIFRVDATVINEKVYYIVIYKIVAITIKNNVIFVCSSFD